MRMTLAEIKNKAKDIIPDGIPYTVDLEAGTISIITPTPDAFAEQSNSLTVKLAKAVRRRIVIRPDPSILSTCLLYTSPSPRDGLLSRMPSSA